MVCTAGLCRYGSCVRTQTGQQKAGNGRSVFLFADNDVQRVRSEMTKRPNILMLVTDDQRYDTIAALGNPHISKPNMDGLAARGMSFTYVYIPGGTVARCVCLAGQCYIQVAICLVYKNAAPTCRKSTILLGNILRQTGYFCFETGQWYNGPLAFPRAFEAGDDIFFSGMWNHWNVPPNRYDPLASIKRK